MPNNNHTRRTVAFNPISEEIETRYITTPADSEAHITLENITQDNANIECRTSDRPYESTSEWLNRICAEPNVHTVDPNSGRVSRHNNSENSNDAEDTGDRISSHPRRPSLRYTTSAGIMEEPESEPQEGRRDNRLYADTVDGQHAVFLRPHHVDLSAFAGPGVAITDRQITPDNLDITEYSSELQALYKELIHEVHNWNENISRDIFRRAAIEYNLPESFIDAFKDYLSWGLICQYQTLSFKFAKLHAHYMKWITYVKSPKTTEKELANFIENGGCSSDLIQTICYKRDLSEEFIDKFKDNLNWVILTEKLPMDLLLKKYKSYIKSNKLCRKSDFTVKMFEKYFFDKVDWYELCQYAFNLQDWERLIKKYDNEGYIIWEGISSRIDLTADFLRKYQDKLYWNACTGTIDNWDLIEEFKTKINWDSINYTKVKVNNKILEKYKNKINWQNLIKFQLLPEDTLEKFTKYLNWSYVCRYQKINEAFIRKHLSKIDLCAISTFQDISEDFREEFDLV